MCCENVSFESRVIPRVFGVFLWVTFDCLSEKVMPYSAGSGVKIVDIVCLFMQRLLVMFH